MLYLLSHTPAHISVYNCLFAGLFSAALEFAYTSFQKSTVFIYSELHLQRPYICRLKLAIVYLHH
jgi:hypothetical protein